MSAASVALTANSSAGNSIQEVSRTRAKARVHPSISLCMCRGNSDNARAGVRASSTPRGWYLCSQHMRQLTLQAVSSSCQFKLSVQVADVSKSALAAMLSIKHAQYISVMATTQRLNAHMWPFRGPNGSVVDSSRARGHQQLMKTPAY